MPSRPAHKKRPKRVIKHHEVLLRLDKDLWGLVRACAARERIPIYKVVEEALATRVRWSGRVHGDTAPKTNALTPKYLTPQEFQQSFERLPTMGDLHRITKAFHKKTDVELF